MFISTLWAFQNICWTNRHKWVVWIKEKTKIKEGASLSLQTLVPSFHVPQCPPPQPKKQTPARKSVHTLPQLHLPAPTDTNLKTGYSLSIFCLALMLFIFSSWSAQVTWEEDAYQAPRLSAMSNRGLQLISPNHCPSLITSRGRWPKWLLSSVFHE